MNSDSIFESDFFMEHRGLIAALTTVTIAFITIFWLYRGLETSKREPEGVAQNQQVTTNAVKVQKRRLTISLVDTFVSDLHNFDISEIYQILDSLSGKFEIYLIILLNEPCPDKDYTTEILEKFLCMFEDNILKKHRVLFSSKLEGVCAMVRSIDPYAHIESSEFVLSNLIRFVNEFWFITHKETEELARGLDKSAPLTNKVRRYTREILNDIGN